jgi:hypothetical protein
MTDPHIIGLYIVDSLLLAGIFYLCFQNKNFDHFTKLPSPNAEDYQTFSNEDNV